MNSLHPRTVSLWRVRGSLIALALAILVGVLMLVLLPEAPSPLRPGPMALGIGVAGLAAAWIWPPLRYRHWRWSVQPDRVQIQRGVIWRSRAAIPRVRIQHVDTRTSPLQRWLGLSSLVIYTAGTRGADVEIPGLTADDAERLREELAELEELDERA